MACHSEVTCAQQKERKDLTKKAKELLKNTVNNQQKDEVSSPALFQTFFENIFPLK